MRAARSQTHPHARPVVFVFTFPKCTSAGDCVYFHICFFETHHSTSRRHRRRQRKLLGAKQRRQRRRAGLSVPRHRALRSHPSLPISLARLVCDCHFVSGCFGFSLITHSISTINRGGIQGVHADQVRARVLGEPDDSSFPQDACTGPGCWSGINPSTHIYSHPPYPYIPPLFIIVQHHNIISCFSQCRSRSVSAFLKTTFDWVSD